MIGSGIAGLTAAGLLSVDLRAHYDLLSRLLVSARLLAPDGQPPAGVAREALAAACRATSFEALLQAVGEARHGVTVAWAETFGETLEEEQ